MPQGLSAVNISEKFALFSDHWAPKIIGAFNDLHIKAAKLKGEFVWHSHADTDELFLVTKGSLIVHLRDATVMVNAGNFFVVPRGVEHMPVAEDECEVLLFEPPGTVNTGNAGGARTVTSETWI
jgi:mannose-6-phosphate isomerase-like protein (cupin superfamily)